MEEINLTWQEEYALGDTYIDNQHKDFFDIAQKAKSLHNNPNQEEKKKELRSIMNELFRYINFHFDCEEKYMKKINYPMIDEHLKQHNEMKDQLKFINFNLLSIDINQAEQKLFNFIQKIFVDHIMQEDLKIINFKKQ